MCGNIFSKKRKSFNRWKAEGIVLKTLDYKESERIITLFTPHEGIISVIVKRLSKKKPHLINLTSPLCRAEVLYRRGKSDLCLFLDGTILDLNLPLRKSYSTLQLGGKMLRAISLSQFPGKPAPLLYKLLLFYLKELPDFPDPEILWASFQLKLLKHEGLLFISKTCAKCQRNPAISLDEGESRCSTCSNAPSFTEEEWKVLLLLFHGRNHNDWKEIPFSKNCKRSIEELFNMRVS